MLEFIATAKEGSEIDAVTAALVELTFKDVFPVRAVNVVERVDKELPDL